MDHVTEHRPGREEGCSPLSEIPGEVTRWDSWIFHPFIQPVDKSCWRWQEAGNNEKAFAWDTWHYKPCLRSGTPPRDTVFAISSASPLNTIDFSRSPVLKLLFEPDQHEQPWTEADLRATFPHAYSTLNPILSFPLHYKDKMYESG